MLDGAIAKVLSLVICVAIKFLVKLHVVHFFLDFLVEIISFLILSLETLVEDEVLQVGLFFSCVEDHGQHLVLWPIDTLDRFVSKGKGVGWDLTDECLVKVVLPGVLVAHLFALAVRVTVDNGWVWKIVVVYEITCFNVFFHIVKHILAPVVSLELALDVLD